MWSPSPRPPGDDDVDGVLSTAAACLALYAWASFDDKCGGKDAMAWPQSRHVGSFSALWLAFFFLERRPSPP